MCDFDSHLIIVVSIKNRTKQSLMKGYKDGLIDLTREVIKPILHRLENEVSKDMIEQITKTIYGLTNISTRKPQAQFFRKSHPNV